MHISLDQALGRQPRLNRVGQSLLNIASGASAAYSLRSLTGDDPDVVRIRRGADDEERDFTASEVASAADLWVNGKQETTLPADVDTAAAAYSLRKVRSDYTGKAVQIRRVYDNVEVDVDFDENGEVSDSSLIYNVDEETDDTGIIAGLGKASGTATLGEFIDQTDTSRLPCDQAPAAAAYSLRKVREAYTGDAVKIRRTSDNVEVDVAFDGNDEVSDSSAITVTSGSSTATTLGSFLTEKVITFNPANNTTVGWYQGSDISLVAGDDYIEFTGAGTSRSSAGRMLGTKATRTTTESSSITFEAKYISGGGLVLGTGYGGSDLLTISASSNGGEWVTYTVSVPPWDGTTTFASLNRRVIFTSSSGTVWQLRNVEVSQVVSSAAVVTWYDQSGNNNHATQSTPANQPKIAEGGTYLGELDFDGINDELDTDSSFAPDQPITAFVVSNIADSCSYFSIGASTESFRMLSSSGSKAVLNAGSPLSSTADVTDEETLLTAVGNTTSSSIFKNGTSVASGDIGTAPTGTPEGLRIGNLHSISRFTDGFFKELIIYDSDQSLNRSYIEKNIGDHYGITVPDVSQDIAVVTWYDQSGNGNDATQDTAASQPLIAEGGSLLADGITFESDVNLPLSGDGLDIFRDVAYGQIFSVIKPRETGTASSRYFEAKNGSGSGARFLFGDGQDVAATFRIGGRALDGDSFGDEESPTSHNNDLSLITGFLNYTDAEGFLFLNGAQVATNSIPNMTAGNTSDTSSALAAIGDAAGSTSPFNAKEIIIFNSDQSSNRFKIESNINNHYGIYTAAEDGFVATWYDQSGNDNDATAAQDEQPKIVNAGSYLGELDFDGVDDFMSFTDIDFTSGDFLVNATYAWDGTGDSYIVADSANHWIIRPFSATGFQSRAEDGTQYNISPTDHTFVSGAFVTTSVFRDGNTLKLSVNGSVDDTTNDVTGETFSCDQLGARAAVAYFGDGMKEVVIYDSDQSSKLSDIETNIVNHYGLS